MRIKAGFLSFLSLMLIISCSPQTRKAYYEGRGDRGKIIETARKQAGVRYKYGGSTPDGFDCSGLMLYSYSKGGIKLPRTADAQYSSGRRVLKNDLKPGDLVFFKIKGNRISHVGMYLGEDKFIHAPRTGKGVAYASIEKPYWKKRFAGGSSYIRD